MPAFHNLLSRVFLLLLSLFRGIRARGDVLEEGENHDIVPQCTSVMDIDYKARLDCTCTFCIFAHLFYLGHAIAQELGFVHYNFFCPLVSYRQEHERQLLRRGQDRLEHHRLLHQCLDGKRK